MILGASISFGFSLAPRIFEDLISTFGWEGAWHAIAAGCAGFALMAFLFYRDSPEAHGLRPDGPLAGTRQTRPTHPESVPGRAFTLPEAKRTYTFWVFAAVLLLSGLTLTAYTFHIVSIFAEAGMGRERAVSVFLPAAIVAVGVEVLASYVSDYVKLKYLAMVNLAGTVTLTLSVAFLAPGLGVFGVIVGQGLMQGVFGILSNVTWPRFFGRAHLGAISGLATAFVVGGTAIGPYLYSFARDVSGSYAPAALSCAAAAVVLLVLIVRANRPE
jgi:sugar phosphate permease